MAGLVAGTAGAGGAATGGGAAAGAGRASARGGLAGGGGPGEGSAVGAPAGRGGTEVPTGRAGPGAWGRRLAGRPLGVLDDARAEKAEEALLRLLHRQGDRLHDLPGRQGSIDAREHEAVGGGEHELLETKQGIGREGQHAVEVAQGVANDVGIAHLADRFEDELARGELEGDLSRDVRLFLELVVPLGPGEDPGHDVLHVEGQGVLELVAREHSHLDQHLPKPLARGLHGFGGPGEVVGLDPALLDDDLAELLALDVGVDVDDVPAAKADVAPLVSLGAPEDSGLAPDVEIPKDAR